MKRIVSIMVVAAAAAIPALAEEHVGYNLERGEPARWDEPLVTPRQHYENAMLEARNAKAEALKECRAQGAQRKACETEAREEYRRDVESAKGFLAVQPPPR